MARDARHERATLLSNSCGAGSWSKIQTHGGRGQRCWMSEVTGSRRRRVGKHFHTRGQFVTHTHQLVLHDSLLLDLVQERLVADAEQWRRLAAVPVHAAQRGDD